MCDPDTEYKEWFKLVGACYKEGFKQGDTDLYYETCLLWSMKSIKFRSKGFETLWKKLFKQIHKEKFV